MNDHVRPKGGANARWIAQRCKEPIFWQFLESTFSEEVTTEAAAVQVVRTYGGVESRAEFDTNSQAARRFHDVLRRPFADFMHRNNQHPA